MISMWFSFEVLHCLSDMEKKLTILFFFLFFGERYLENIDNDVRITLI
jgi:hypothetical protein